MENQHQSLKKWELRRKSIEDAEYHKDETERRLTENQETIEAMRDLVQRMDARLTVVEQNVKDRDRVILQRDVEAERQKVEFSEMMSKHAAKVAQLELVIASLNETIDDLDPVFILCIHIRSLLDKIRAALFEDVTGIPAEECNRNVNAWWSHALDPSAKKKVYMDEAAIDEHRFKTLHHLLVKKGLMSDPRYIALVNTGTLRYLSQTNIDIRKQANRHAHEVNVAGLHSVLLRATTTQSNVCSEGDMICINSAIDFLLTAPVDN
ncbi:hypothetical protein HYPSUDRAFT_60108 [Hypholoma sublateritium FD-334 SS-4]|uniref:Uncharacterized protein n=1 Tax=Hypholoma sublateritium (strain FD-334 SS-4) TaxID=945553 RepID=A0A0D2N1F7_HYPSF|nr:hypothetical protein HYPSUDRAFT_60108 [Hypholoma sublateritium FD-334 SS-4]